MASRGSAKRYAQAIFEMALSSQSDDAERLLDEWSRELGLIKEAFGNEEFKVFLRHAKVPLERKIEAINSVLPELGGLARNLLALMVSRRMIDYIWRVEAEYHTLVDRHRGVERVKVYSAVPLEDGERKRISAFVEGMIGKQVILEAEVDQSVLGGLIIRVGDRLLDGSSRAKLKTLQQELETVPIGNGTQGYMEEAST